MIVDFHYVDLDASLQSQPFSFKKILFELTYSYGWIGNFIFFAISVWFLIDRSNTLRSSLRRVWILERELLFWSVILFVVTVIMKSKGVYIGDLSTTVLAIQSALPLSTTLWWYPTSYALFLVFLPFLNIGMKHLTQKQHKELALVCLVIWGILGLIPKMNFDLTNKSVFVFIYWYILLSYYRWYMKELTSKQCWCLVGIGVSVCVIWLLATNALFSFTGRMLTAQSYIFQHWRLPVLMIGLGVFLLVIKTEFHSWIINTLASSAFGVFLIHSYPSVWLFWTHRFPLAEIYQKQYAWLIAIGVAFGVFVVCLILDLIRQGLFRLTVDRHRGAWFDRLYNWVSLKSRNTSNPQLPKPGAVGDDSDLVD